MLISVFLLVASMVALFVYASSRSFKQSEVLLFNKRGIVARQSRFVVCSKCGRTQAANGGYQECCRTRM